MKNLIFGANVLYYFGITKYFGNFFSKKDIYLGKTLAKHGYKTYYKRRD